MANKKKDKRLFKPAGEAELANRMDNTLSDIEKKIDKINERLDAIIREKHKSNLYPGDFIMGNPHDQWADFYDLAYEATGKTLYTGLTEKTLREIANIVKPPARVIDFGAGTGRLSLPLVLQGFHVTAIEPSRGMYRVLEEKAKKEKIQIGQDKELFIVNKSIQNDLTTTIRKESYDLAICVFTTLNYLLEESEIKKLGQACNHGLKNKGKLLVSFVEDMKQMQAAYNPRPLPGDRGPDRIERRIHIQGRSPRFEYNEVSEGIQDNKRFKFGPVIILLREWQEKEVVQILGKAGLKYCENRTHEFVGYGETYLLFEKSAVQ